MQVSRLCCTERRTWVTRDACPIANRSLTQRRATVVWPHNHQASTCFSNCPLGIDPNSCSRKPKARKPFSNSSFPCASPLMGQSYIFDLIGLLLLNS